MTTEKKGCQYAGWFGTCGGPVKTYIVDEGSALDAVYRKTTLCKSHKVNARVVEECE